MLIEGRQDKRPDRQLNRLEERRCEFTTASLFQVLTHRVSGRKTITWLETGEHREVLACLLTARRTSLPVCLTRRGCRSHRQARATPAPAARNSLRQARPPLFRSFHPLLAGLQMLVKSGDVLRTDAAAAAHNTRPLLDPLLCPLQVRLRP